MARRGRKPKQAPRPRYKLVANDTQEGQEIRGLIADLCCSIAQHRELGDALITPAWMVGIKPDRDGRIVLGKMKKANELERELHGFDAILLLNQEHWRILKPEQRRALVDHELCHLAPAMDPTTLEQKVDAHGRKCWRTRKHDLEEFRDVVQRHGMYKADIASFVQAANESRALPLFPLDAPPAAAVPGTILKAVADLAPKDGEGTVTIEAGGKSVTLTAETGRRARAALKADRQRSAEGAEAH